MEDSPKKMRFSQIASQKPSSNPDQIPVVSCKPNRSNSPTNSSDSSQPHHHPHEEVQIVVREQKDQCNGRDRFKRHREEVAGRVVVPDRWGKEELMKDWIDYSSFDKLLAPSGIRSAREALVMEAQRRQAGSSNSTSQRLRIESRC